jgi:hypothetical protein
MASSKASRGSSAPTTPAASLAQFRQLAQDRPKALVGLLPGSIGGRGQPLKAARQRRGSPRGSLTRHRSARAHRTEAARARRSFTRRDQQSPCHLESIRRSPSRARIPGPELVLGRHLQDPRTHVACANDRHVNGLLPVAIDADSPIARAEPMIGRGHGNGPIRRRASTVRAAALRKRARSLGARRRHPWLGRGVS